MKISDEIREWCDDAYSGRKIRTTKDLYVIADLIDRDMVELPKDAQMAYIEAEREVDRLQTENAKLRELLEGAFEDMVAWQRVIACSTEWGYGRGCREQLVELRDAMRDLGVEVDFDGR